MLGSKSEKSGKLDCKFHIMMRLSMKSGQAFILKHCFYEQNVNKYRIFQDFAHLMFLCEAWAFGDVELPLQD